MEEKKSKLFENVNNNNLETIHKTLASACKCAFYYSYHFFNVTLNFGLVIIRFHRVKKTLGCDTSIFHS